MITLSEENLKTFKLRYINEITKRYVEKEMKTDFSIKSDLSAIDLEVRQSESEEYHRRIDSLKREVSYLKQFQDDSIEKDRKIEELEDKLRKTGTDADNQYEGIRERLKLKSTQLLEAQNNIADLNLNISRLESNILELETNIGSKKIDIDSLHKQLNNAKEDLNNEKSRYEEYISNLKFDTNLEKESLESNISFRQSEIKRLVEQRDIAQKEKEDLVSFQTSLQIKLSELESSLDIFETNLDVEKSLKESKERELNMARDEIRRLEEEIKTRENFKNLEISDYENKIRFLKETKKIAVKEVEDKKLEIENTKRDYEDRIRENETEIGSLRFERENLNDRVAELNREIERSDNISDVLTTQLDLANTEVINLNGRIQELQVQNQTLTTELDSLISNFGNLVAASEATNHNNTLEIRRLEIKIKELEDNNDINERVNELLKSVDNYKGLLDDAYEDKKKLKKEFEEEFDKLNKEKESLVQDLKNKSKNEEDLMKKLWQNENNYSLLTQKYEKSFSTIYDLTLALDKTSEREKILEGELEHRESRIKAKDEEVTEKMTENEKLKKQIEDNNFNIKNSDFYEQQYNKTKIELDKTTSERNNYIQDLNRSKEDNEELEDEIEVLEKEIEILKKDRDLAKSKIIPKEKVDQMRHDNQELNKQLDVREKQLKEVVESYRIVKNEHDMAMNNFNKLKKTINKRVDSIKNLMKEI